MLVRLNWGTQYATQWAYHESRNVPMISAADAVALGADVVLVGMSIKTGSEAVDAENVEMVARCVAEKRAAGVPIVGEVYPEDEARRLADARGWTVRQDGIGWRRVVGSPQPQRVVETRLIGDVPLLMVIVETAGSVRADENCSHARNASATSS